MAKRSNFQNENDGRLRLLYLYRILEQYTDAEYPLTTGADKLKRNYLDQLLMKYDKKASVTSEEAGLTTSYVGNIVNGRKRNPSRDALISICLAIGTMVEEVRYLLKNSGQASLENGL